MSKLFDWFYNDLGKGPSESEMQEIRNIVLEEAGFKWIPVSERLPENGEPVLVSDELHIVYEAEHNAIWLYEDGDKVKRKVLAWMPLPKPYNPQP